MIRPTVPIRKLAVIRRLHGIGRIPFARPGREYVHGKSVTGRRIPVFGRLQPVRDRVREASLLIGNQIPRPRDAFFREGLYLFDRFQQIHAANQRCCSPVQLGIRDIRHADRFVFIAVNGQLRAQQTNGFGYRAKRIGGTRRSRLGGRQPLDPVVRFKSAIGNLPGHSHVQRDLELRLRGSRRRRVSVRLATIGCICISSD